MLPPFISYLLQIVLVVAAMILLVWGTWNILYKFWWAVYGQMKESAVYEPNKALKESLKKRLKKFGWKIKDDPKEDNDSRTRGIVISLVLLIVILACVLGS